MTQRRGEDGQRSPHNDSAAALAVSRPTLSAAQPPASLQPSANKPSHHPSAAQPSMAQPTAAQPSAAQPSAAQPSVAQPSVFYCPAIQAQPPASQQESKNCRAFS